MHPLHMPLPEWETAATPDSYLTSRAHPPAGQQNPSRFRRNSPKQDFVYPPLLPTPRLGAPPIFHNRPDTCSCLLPEACPDGIPPPSHVSNVRVASNPVTQPSRGTLMAVTCNKRDACARVSRNPPPDKFSFLASPLYSPLPVLAVALLHVWRYEK